MKIDADGAWKDVCAEKLPLVLALLYKEVHDSLDWSKDYEALDPELRRLTADVLEGNRIADRLIKAFDLLTGDPRYFHVEAQGKRERAFRRRVFVCNCRCGERYAVHVCSLVILTDTDLKWRPKHYLSGYFPIKETAQQGDQKKRRRRYHDEQTLCFLVAKVIDYEGKEQELEADENPFGLFMVANVTALRNRKNPKKRAEVKLRLLLNLRQRKMTAADVQFWERCFDRLLPLPESSQRAIWEHLQQLDTEQAMTFVSFAEQRGLDKGIEKGQRMGLIEGIGVALDLKFGAEGVALLLEIEKVETLAVLQAISKAIKPASSLDDIRKLIPVATNGQT